MKASKIMSRDVKVINKEKSVQEAAKMMKDEEIGSIPVEENEKLVGMVTDRDLTLKVLGEGGTKDMKVGDCLNGGIKYCYEDESVEEIASQMGKLKVRRMPVMDRNDKLVGIVSLGDLATEQSSQQEAIKAFSKIAM